MSTLSERLRDATRDIVTGERLLPGLFGHSPIEDLEAAADELDRLTARVAELEKHERRLKAMMPLFEEARDALPAISLVAAKLHRVDLSLADRMDQVGDPVKWAALEHKHE